MNRLILIFLALQLTINSSEFVIPKKEREQKKLATLSYARLKEELAYRCDPTIRRALHTIDLLARYQKLIILHNLSTTIMSCVADMQRALSNSMLILVDGVSDLAQDNKQTSFGKAGKKELKAYCDTCYELELLLEDICKELTNCLSTNKIDETKKECQVVGTKLDQWRKSIENKSQLLI
jgi:hypothetical protein